MSKLWDFISDDEDVVGKGDPHLDNYKVDHKLIRSMGLIYKHRDNNENRIWGYRQSTKNTAKYFAVDLRVEENTEETDKKKGLRCASQQ